MFAPSITSKAAPMLFLYQVKPPAKRSHHFKATCRNIVKRRMMLTFDPPVARYCDMLGVVPSNLKMVKFFMQHLRMLYDMVFLWSHGIPLVCSSMLRSGMRKLVRFSRLKISQHFTTRRPNARNMLLPTMGTALTTHTVLTSVKAT